MVGVLSGGRVLKNNVIGRLVLTWSMQRSTPGSQLPGLRRQKDDLSPAFLHSVRHRLVWQSCPVVPNNAVRGLQWATHDALGLDRVCT